MSKKAAWQNDLENKLSIAVDDATAAMEKIWASALYAEGALNRLSRLQKYIHARIEEPEACVLGLGPKNRCRCRSCGHLFTYVAESGSLRSGDVFVDFLGDPVIPEFCPLCGRKVRSAA